MENDLYGIGETARASGLSISALRFYDGAGVLVPARVDPVTGYRRYSAGQVREAELLAALRRARLPLADVRLVLAARSGGGTAFVAGVLAAHLSRLEADLAAARLEFSAVRTLIDRWEYPLTSEPTARPAAPVRLTAPAAALAAALDAVRPAAGTDPALPVLGGVLVDAGPDGLTLVATDRYRLHLARVPGAVVPAPVRTLLPAALADAVRALLPGDGTAVLTFGAGRAEVRAGGSTVEGACPEHDYPDHRRLLAVPGTRRLTAGAAALRTAAADHPFEDAEHAAVLTLLAPGPGDALTVLPAPRDAAGTTAVDRHYLHAALDALGDGPLLLDHAGPTAPLTWRRSGDDDRLVLLMPVRLGGAAAV